MNDIVMAILSGLLSVIMAGILIIIILLVVWGILDTVGNIADWFTKRFGK